MFYFLCFTFDYFWFLVIVCFTSSSFLFSLCFDSGVEVLLALFDFLGFEVSSLLT